MSLSAVEIKFNDISNVVPVFGCSSLVQFLEDINETCSLTGQIPTFQIFEYDDEEGDRICVRAEEDFQLMLSSFEAWASSSNAPALLCIYPKCDSTSGSFSGEYALVSETTIMDSGTERPMGQSIRKEPSVDLEQILSSGQIYPGAIKYLQPLGSGVSGTVYKAIDTKNDLLMAVKSISLDVAYQTQQQILSEMEILHKCHSPHIIAFYGAFFTDNHIYVCMEYMDGSSFNNVGTVPEHILGPVASCVAQGLSYLWSWKIMHRDVKPSNILVNSRGEIKLCDFGVSVQLANSIAKTYVGTNAYMAPERILGAEYGIHSDIWSFGLTLFELAIGHFPYQPDASKVMNSLQPCKFKPVELIRAIIDQDPPNPDDYGLTSKFRNLIRCCLVKNPGKRPVPEALMQHPFIQQHISYDRLTVAHWVNSTRPSSSLQDIHTNSFDDDDVDMGDFGCETPL